MSIHQPKNYLESVLNAKQVERAARQLLQERRGTVQQPPEPYLKTIETKDGAGRTITTFQGDPGVWMSHFAAPPQKLVGIRTKFK
jgi:hypothetical protein